MTTKKDRDFDLATLRKLLAEAEERASKAESRLVEQTPIFNVSTQKSSHTSPRNARMIPAF